MKIDHCASSPCQNYATCKSLAEGYQCSCRPGYEGVQCERDIDECASDPCQNNGTCVDGENRYTCNCKGGFTGTRCETDINECLLEPCQNGGVCVDKENGFECICKPTYSGNTCSKSKTFDSSSNKLKDFLVITNYSYALCYSRYISHVLCIINNLVPRALLLITRMNIIIV